jgi:hypothetical protein
VSGRDVDRRSSVDQPNRWRRGRANVAASAHAIARDWVSDRDSIESSVEVLGWVEVAEILANHV